MIGIGLSLSKQIKLSAPAVTRGYNLHAFYNIILQSKSNFIGLKHLLFLNCKIENDKICPILAYKGACTNHVDKRGGRGILR